MDDPSDTRDREVRPLAAARGRFPIVNTLGELRNPNAAAKAGGDPDLHRRLVDNRAIEDAHAAGLTALNITIASPLASFEQTLRQVGAWEQLIQSYPADLIKVSSVKDIQRAWRTGRIGVILGLQNLVQIDRNLERLEVYATFGIRVLQLTYNVANQVGDGAMAIERRGLTDFGHEVVARLNELGLAIDLSHSAQKTCLDAARVSKQPVCITHTGCRSLCDSPRNASDEELRLIAAKGGYVGIYFMPYLRADWHPDPEDVVRHIDHMIDICGEDQIGIGTDGSITKIDDLKAYEQENARQVAERVTAGISAGEQAADTFPFIADLTGVHQFHKLIALLEKRRHTASRIEKIMGGNFIRFANEVWGSRTHERDARITG